MLNTKVDWIAFGDQKGSLYTKFGWLYSTISHLPKTMQRNVPTEQLVRQKLCMDYALENSVIFWAEPGISAKAS